MLRVVTMDRSVSERRLSSISTVEEEHSIVGPSSKCPLHKGFKEEKPEENKEVDAVYDTPLLKAPYDLNIVKEISTQSDRYKNLRPKVVFQMLGERRTYTDLKKVAISRLESNLKKKFSIFSQAIERKKNEVMPKDELFHSIFSWKWSDFLTRRKLTNFVWVDILLRMRENRMHFYKFLKDLYELQWFLGKIFDGLLSDVGEEPIDIYEHIDKAKKALKTTDYTKNEFHMNYKEFKQLLHKEYFFTNAKRSSEDRLLKTYLENRILNSHIWDPIEIRYHTKWYKNVVKQNQCRTDVALEKYENDIAHYKDMLDKEKSIDGNYMDYCYSSIEVYKNRLIQVQEKLNKELHDMENKLTYIKLQTDKLTEQRQWLADEIQRFHEEKEKIVSQIEVERDKYRQQLEGETKEVLVKKQRRRNKKQRR